MIPTGRNQSVMSATTHQPGKMPLCLSFEHEKPKLFIRLRTHATVATSPGALGRPPYLTYGFEFQPGRMRGRQANLRAATRVGATVRSEHAKDLKKRNSSRCSRSKRSKRFPSGAALPLEQQIQRTHIPTRRAAAACATGATAPTAPTAPRRASGTTPPRVRRRPERRAEQPRQERSRPGRRADRRDDRDDGGVFHQ